ncbi:MAG: acyltransferase [Clostridia bacterium]|nr:acyltransferase [Clostridia bacterium]
MINWLKSKYWKILNSINFKLNNVKCDKNFGVNGLIVISHTKLRKNEKNNILIGKGVFVNAGWHYNKIGKGERTILRTIGDGVIQIGDNVAMSNVSICSMSKIIIDDNVMLGGGVVIYDTDFHSLNPMIRRAHPFDDICCKRIHIKRNAFIGAGVYILKGVTIGENSVIGAGSVVACNVPDNEIWGGNPARFIREI